MKTRLEKVLHELCRDLPKVDAVNDLYTRGVLTFPDALEYIARIYREEKEKSSR